MTEYPSPVPVPALDAEPPAPYTGIYGMPAFVTVPTVDLEASRRFWLDGLGFVDLVTIPGTLTHVRRWAFQDVLLVPGDPEPAPTRLTVGFACVLRQLDEIATRCEALVPGCTEGPRDVPWNSIELTVTTPERVRVVMTAAKPLDLGGETAARLREAGFDVPEA